MEINKPIFVIGAPRSGTTMFLNAVSHHRNLATFNNINLLRHFYQLTNGTFLRHFYVLSELVFVVYPKITIFFHRKFDTPLWPVEANIIYELLFFNSYKLIHDENEATEYREKFIKKVFIRNLEAYGKKRIFYKDPTHITQSFRFLNKVFPDALFLNIIRDGRAVTNSLLNFHAFPFMRKWYFDGLKEEEREKIKRYPYLEAAQVWKKSIQESKICKEKVGPRYLEMKYEKLVNNPLKSFRSIIDFFELDWDWKLASHLKTMKFENRNYKWKNNLDTSKLLDINDYLKKELVEFKYLDK